jgi:predicted nucleotidyltransferase
VELQFLDHYYVELRNGSLGVVVGSSHARSFVIGYVKYKPTVNKTPWFRSGIHYERIVKYYSASSVREHTNWRMYIPHYDCDVPIIPISEVARLYNPLDRSIELERKTSDKLEVEALRLIHEVSINTGVLPGVTGSLLPGIHNVESSDIDLVVYGLRESTRVVEYIAENISVFESFRDGKLEEWRISASRSTGLPAREVEKFYRNWRRGVFNGRDYSIIYNDGVYREVINAPVYRTLGRSKIVADVSGGLSGLNYPSSSRILSYKIKSSNIPPPFDITEVLSFEALYIPALYEGGVFEIDGLLQCSFVIEDCRLTIGVYEEKTYMKYYS